MTARSSSEASTSGSRSGPTSWPAMFITASPTPVKAALNLLGHDAGTLRLPMVEADEAETAAVRSMLERHGLLAPVHSA